MNNKYYKKIANEQELFDYIKNTCIGEKRTTSMSSVYYLIKTNECTEPIYFTHYQGSFFESPCCFMKHEMSDEELKEYVDYMYVENAREEAYKFEKSMCLNGYHYDIECPQCTPFLTYPLEIIDVLSEQEAIKWYEENHID